MELGTYLDTVVRPNVVDFDGYFASVRLAHNVVHAVDALAAHMFVAAGGTSKGLAKDDVEFRERLAEKNEMFRLVRDVATAARHVEISPWKPKVGGATQASRKTLDWEAPYGEGPWVNHPQVVVETDSGQHHAFRAVVKEALAFLENEMKALGLKATSRYM